MDEQALKASLNILPSNHDAERSVLGALMQDASALSEALELLEAEDFYQPHHGVIFTAMRTLVHQSRAVDLVTLNDELTKTGQIDGIGGVDYLIGLMQYVPTTVNVRHHFEILLEKSTLRKLIGAANEISQNCFQQTMELSDILAHAEKSVFDIVMKRSGAKRLVHISEVLTHTYQMIEELFKSKGEIKGVPTGYASMDNLLTGFHPGELILIGARPSMGKTSFAINLAANAALRGKSVAIFSLEMPNDQIAMRILCCEARVDQQKIRQGALSDEDWRKLATTAAPLAKSSIYLDDSSSISPSQLRSRLRKLMLEHPLDMVLIDYLQLMSSDNRSENRQLEVSEVSRKLKAIAMELKIPVVACAQLSRANVQRQDKKPMLSDLRDSGSIEQDADVVMFLHRPGYYKPEEEDINKAEVIIAKQRNGPLGTVDMYWHSEYTLFEELVQ